MKIKSLLLLLRINQWYKNLVIYLGIIFSGLLLNINLLSLVTLGFISLCLLSSTNYIINDIIDRKKDIEHPEKKKRPIASGEINIYIALILALILFIISLYLAYIINLNFFYTVVILFIITTFYSILLKNVLFLDILIISTNFVIRAVSGIFIIKKTLSPWLVLCPFFLALFLVVGKRKADLDLLKTNAESHKLVLKHYTPEITNALLIISTTLLIISYSLYAFLSEHKYLLLTLPFAIYVIFKYLFLIYTESEIARKPHIIYKDKELLIGIIMWILITLLLLYL